MPSLSALSGGFRRGAGLATWLEPAWLAALVSLIASIPLTLAVLEINHEATFVDRAPIRQHVADAFDSGALTADFWSPAGAVDRGSHQFNDCLILSMVLHEEGESWQRALAPRADFSGGNPCLALQAMVEAPVGAEIAPAEPYARYLHGHTAFAALLLNPFSLETARKLLGFATVVVLALLTASAIFLAWRRTLRGEGSPAATAGFVAVAAAAFLLFFGGGGYSMSLSHFPADMVLFAYLWFVLLVDPSRWTLPANIAVHAVFGVATAWMEFLTGGLPLGACLIAYVLASQAASRPSEQLQRFFVAGAAFVAAFGGAYVFKMFLTAQALGPEAWASFVEGLQHRVAGAPGSELMDKAPSLAGAWREMLWHAQNVGAGWRDLGRVLIAASFLSVAYAAIVMLRRRQWNWQLVQPGLLIVAFLAIVLWHIAFYPHSMVHAHFMVRTLVGLYFTSGMLLLCLHREQLGAMARSAGALLAPQRV
jgi:hypothetical protein